MRPDEVVLGQTRCGLCGDVLIEQSFSTVTNEWFYKSRVPGDVPSMLCPTGVQGQIIYHRLPFDLPASLQRADVERWLSS